MSVMQNDDVAVEAARAITAAVNGKRVHLNGVFHVGGVPMPNAGGIITSGEIAVAALAHAGFKIVRIDPSE